MAGPRSPCLISELPLIQLYFHVLLYRAYRSFIEVRQVGPAIFVVCPVDIARNRLNYCIRLRFHQVIISGQHYPHRAPKGLIDKHEGVYDACWDELRTRRYARQVDLGVMPPGLTLFASDSL